MAPQAAPALSCGLELNGDPVGASAVELMVIPGQVELSSAPWQKDTNGSFKWGGGRGN